MAVMLNVINKINLNPREKQFDFLQNKNNGHNAIVTKDCIKSTMGFLANGMPLSQPTKIVQVKSFDGSTYILDSNGYLYKHEGEERKVCDLRFSTDYKMGYVDYQERTAIIVFSSISSVLLDDGIPYTLPYTGVDYAYAFGRIFYFTKNALYFSKPYEFFGEPDGAINIEDVAGQFRKLYVIHDDLYVICSKRIYKIPRFASVDDIRLNVLQLVVKNVSSKVVFGIGDKVYFLEDYKICCFDGKTIRKIPTCLNANDYVLYVGNSGEDDGIINVHVNRRATGKNYVFRFDTTTEDQSLIEFSGKLMPYFSACISSDGKFMELSSDATVNVNYASNSTDFSDEQEKLAYSISGYSSEIINLTLEGEFGLKTIQFNKGYNCVYCNFKFNTIKISFSTTAKDFVLQNLKIKYTVTK